VWQHIAGVVGYTWFFLGNLADFPALKGFLTSVKIWRNYRHSRMALFLRHSLVT